jgi:hypothetical protein
MPEAILKLYGYSLFDEHVKSLIWTFYETVIVLLESIPQHIGLQEGSYAYE